MNPKSLLSKASHPLTRPGAEAEEALASRAAVGGPAAGRIEPATVTPAEPAPHARLRSIVLVLLALDLALIAWVLLTGGRRFSVLGGSLSMRHVAGPLWAFLLLGLTALWTTPTRRPPLVRLAHELAAPFRAAGVARKLGAGVLALAFIAAVAGWLGAPDAGRRVVTKATRSPAAILTNGAHEHLETLVGRIARRPAPDAVVVDIWGADARGHLAAFYAYPRLIYMVPALKRWTLASRMQNGASDPLFEAPGERPSVVESESYARELGLDILETYPRDDTFPALHED